MALGEKGHELCIRCDGPAIVLIGGLTAFGIGAAPAAARVRDHDQFHNTISDVTDECPGLTLRFDVDLHGMFLENSHGRDGLVYFTETHHSTLSITNLANGLTMTELRNSIDKDLKVTDNGDGTLTLVKQISGVQSFKGPDGKIKRMNTGTVRFEILLDHGGTPTDPSDDEVLADPLRVIKDLTGQSEIDTFCAVAQELIG